MNRTLSFALFTCFLITAIAIAALPVHSTRSEAGAAPQIAPTPTLPPNYNARINSTDRVRLRSGPELHYAQVGSLDPGAPVRLIAVERLANHDEYKHWYMVRTVDGQTGWVFSDLIARDLDQPETLPLDPAPLPAANDLAPSGTLPDDLRAHLVLPDSVLDQAAVIFARGQALGNHADRFILIGDSTSAGNEYTIPAFCAFEWGTYDLGEYSYLQAEIDTFSESFCAEFQTLHSGYSTGHMFEVMWSDPFRCPVGENPLECEYTLTQPAVAIIYIGLVEVYFDMLDEYVTHLDAILAFLVDHGVIPILVTVTSADEVTEARGYVERMARLNDTVRDLAARYDLPVIDFQRAAADLPNQGCVDEGFHLSYSVDGVLNFNGDEQRFGKDLRALLTLHMLRALRLCVFEGQDCAGF